MTTEDPKQTEANLCISCGLCCDGTFFLGKYHTETDTTRNTSSEATESDEATVSDEPPQPCAHLSGNKGCTIYGIRPHTCAEYRCHLLHRLSMSSVSFTEALKIVDLTKRQRDEVMAAIDAKACFLTPTPLHTKFEQVFINGRAASVGNLKEDAEAFLSLGLLQHLIKKHFAVGRDAESSNRH